MHVSSAGTDSSYYPYTVAPTGNIILQKINETFKGFQNVFGIADNILIVGYDANNRDHDRALAGVIQIFQQENLKCSKNKCNFRCSKIPFLEK